MDLAPACWLRPVAEEVEAVDEAEADAGGAIGAAAVTLRVLFADQARFGTPPFARAAFSRLGRTHVARG